MLHIKFGFNWPSGLEEKMFEYYGNILLPISCKIFTSNDFLKVFPIPMHWRPMLTLWCFIPSFFEISPQNLEKKIFEGFLPYMGMAAILVT